MYCEVCGTQLPLGARACPNCGTLTPASYTNSSASPYDPTTPAVLGSSPSVMSAPPPPPTQYGANPYESSWQSPYPVNPYEATPPPPPQRPSNRIGIIAGVILLILLLISGGVFAWLQYSAARNTVATPVRPTANAAVQHFTAKGNFTILSRTNVSVRQDGQNKIYSYTQQGVDSGDITGSFTEEETSIVHPDNTANFSGTSTCTCTVAGKSGSFIYSYTGTSTADGSFQGQTFEGHGSGTGDLAKLHGQGVFQGQGTHGTYSSQLYFA